MKPTEDTKLHDRITQMFNTAEATWEWSSSKKVADERQRVFIRHLLTVLGEWGYRKQYTCLRCNHQWYPRTPNIPKWCPNCNSPYWDKPRKHVLVDLGNEPPDCIPELDDEGAK